VAVTFTALHATAKWNHEPLWKTGCPQRILAGWQREKCESLLRCPICERTGLADMSDDKSSKIGEYDTRIEAVTQGFEIKGKDVICSECQVSAL
jgi:hypothetical protein